MDFQERLIWGQFLPIVVACVFYGMDVLAERRGARPWPVLGVMVAIVVLQVLYLIVVAALSRPEPRDERTRLIEMKAYRVAYLLAMVLLFGWVGAAMMQVSGMEGWVRDPVLLVFVFFGVEAVRTGTQVALYRRGVRA